MNQREIVTLKVEKREGRGKGSARKLRAEGRIPANIYGHGINSMAVEADAQEFEALADRISVDNTLVRLTMGSRSRQVLIREIQRHPVKRRVLHVDFFAIKADEKIRVSVPVRVTGTAVGVKNGGVLQQTLHEVEIEVLPSEIPEAFEIDVSELEIGDSLHVSQLDTMGFEPSEAPDRTIVSVQPPRVLEEETEEEEEGIELEEGMEPEVITARGEDEEAAAEEQDEES